MRCGIQWCTGTAVQRLVGSGPLCQKHVELALAVADKLNSATHKALPLVFAPLEEPSDIATAVEPGLGHAGDTFRDLRTGEVVP